MHGESENKLLIHISEPNFDFFHKEIAPNIELKSISCFKFLHNHFPKGYAFSKSMLDLQTLSESEEVRSFYIAVPAA
jgi:hypothetical protein